MPETTEAPLILGIHNGALKGDPAGSPIGLPIDTHFDTQFADEMARLETFNKHHYRPNTYLHKWWARRCGSTFRLILKHLVTDPVLQDYYTAGGLEGKIVLDPMMGGGTTLHEAIRMGANVIGVDIDPVPVMQARASLSDVSLPELEEAFADLFQSLTAGIGNYFTTTCPDCDQETPLRYVLYGLRRYCACGQVIMVDGLVLRYEAGEPAVWLCAICAEICRRGSPCGCRPGNGGPRLRIKEELACSYCGERFQEEVQPYYERYEPLVIVGQCRQHGLFYKTPTKDDLLRIACADQTRKSLLDSYLFADDFRIVNGPKSKDLQSRNINTYLELFSSRQLIFLAEVRQLLPSYSEIVRLNLALLISTSLEFNSLLCGYKGARQGDRPGAIRHTFSYHAYTFPYTALENNIIFPQKASGTLQKLFHDRIRRARQWAGRPRERRLSGSHHFVTIDGEKDWGMEEQKSTSLKNGKRRFFLHRGSATALPIEDRLVDFVVTDPPYFDSVQYNDLAAFFRVWLQQFIPTGIDWHYDPAGAAVDPHTNGAGQYTRVLQGIFSECRRVLKPSTGRLIFTFHHWDPRGWAALTIALQHAGFELINRYVVQSENPVSVHIANVSSLKHDAIFVLAPAGMVKTPDWERPQTIDKTDSFSFCYDCATMVGWLLSAGITETDIRHHWQTYLAQ